MRSLRPAGRVIAETCSSCQGGGIDNSGDLCRECDGRGMF